MGDRHQRLITKWALTLTALSAKNADREYFTDRHNRSIIEVVDAILAEMRDALGVEASATPGPADIDFHTLKPISEVAS